MSDFKLIDTFRDFQDYWNKSSGKSIHEQIDNWLLDYMNKWPKLRDKQTEDYEKSGEKWREIAQKYVSNITIYLLTPYFVHCSEGQQISQIFHSAFSF